MKKLTQSIALAIMKISLVQLIILLGAFCSFAKPTEGQSALDQQVTLHLKNIRIKNVLSEIEKMSDVKFIYSPELIRSSRKVDVVANRKKLELVLQELLTPLDVRFELQKLRYSYIVLTRADVMEKAPEQGMYNNVVYADTFRLAGTVKDKTNTPLEGVTVALKGSSVATMTNQQGGFVLKLTEKSAVLVFSYTGMESQEMTVTSGTPVTVSLVPRVNTYDEIIVVGYGQQKKSLVTGAISSVKADELATVSSTRIEQALQGRTAGVTVLPASGSPGSGMRVRIRGTGSNGSSEPLYIVDGVRAGGIEYLDPSEIASVEVLKDAASAAIYGAEGANGVVLITTKMGKRNSAAEISYSTQYGRQSVGRKMPMMNPQQYVDYLKTSNTPVPTALPDNSQLASIKGTKWFDEIFKNAPLQRHTLNISGGSEKSSYLIAGTLFKQQGIVGGDKARFDRYTFRVNTDNRLKSWLNVGNRFSYSHFARKGITEDSEFGSVINNALMMDPITPVIYTGALPAHAQAAIAAGNPLVKNADGYYYGVSPYIFGEVGNPLAQMAITHTETVQNKVVGNVYADLEPLKGLKITTRFGIDAAFQRTHGWNPTFWWSSERLNTTANTFDRNDNWFNWQWENFATYQKTIDNHSFTILAGTSALKRNWNYLNGTASGMFKEEDRLAYADFEPDAQDRVGSNATINTLVSYYGRLSYDYKGKYLLNATVRRDGSSLLAPGHQWGTFPSVSAGWVLSNESFFSSNVVNYVKVRGSWGKNGSLSNIGLGQYLSAITTQGILYPDASGNMLVGAAPANLSNPDLKWETSEQIDIGADLSFLKGRLNLTVDYYKKTTKDLLTPGTPPLFVGNTLPFVNGGDVQNRGWEFEISYNNKNRSNGNFRYEVAANLTTIHNEVTYLNPNVNQILGTKVGTGWSATVFQQGYPIWYFSGYKTNGIFQTQAQITDYLTKTGITGYNPKPGDPIIVDVNGDKVISSSDYTNIGSPHPKFVYGGRINVEYKGFDLLFFIQGQAGNKVLMGFNRGDRATANKPAFFYDRRWTGANSTNSWFAPNTSSDYVYNSDLMIFNGSYARIRQLQVGYTLPEKLTSHIKIRNARLYVSLDDFFTFTNYPGLDPEAGSNNNNSLGIDRGVYPVPRKVLAGLSFSF